MTAITRTEKYLDAIAGNGDPPEYPITREEQFLNAVLTGGTAPEPITREEMYLTARLNGTTPPEPITLDEMFWRYFADGQTEPPAWKTRLQYFISQAAVPPEPSDSSLVGTGTVGMMIVA